MKKLALLVFLLLPLAACDWLDSSSPSEPDRVLTDGRCSAALPGQIVCEDSTVVIGGDYGLETIQWVVRSLAGFTVDSENSEPEGEVTFTGLSASSYSVEQTPYLEDGEPGPTRVYSVDVF